VLLGTVVPRHLILDISRIGQLRGNEPHDHFLHVAPTLVAGRTARTASLLEVVGLLAAVVVILFWASLAAGDRVHRLAADGAPEEPLEEEEVVRLLSALHKSAPLGREDVLDFPELHRVNEGGVDHLDADYLVGGSCHLAAVSLAAIRL